MLLLLLLLLLLARSKCPVDKLGELNLTFLLAPHNVLEARVVRTFTQELSMPCRCDGRRRSRSSSISRKGGVGHRCRHSLNAPSSLLNYHEDCQRTREQQKHAAYGSELTHFVTP